MNAITQKYNLTISSSSTKSTLSLNYSNSENTTFKSVNITEVSYSQEQTSLFDNENSSFSFDNSISLITSLSNSSYTSVTDLNITSETRSLTQADATMEYSNSVTENSSKAENSTQYNIVITTELMVRSTDEITNLNTQVNILENYTLATDINVSSETRSTTQADDTTDHFTVTETSIKAENSTRDKIVIATESMVRSTDEITTLNSAINILVNYTLAPDLPSVYSTTEAITDAIFITDELVPSTRADVTSFNVANRTTTKKDYVEIQDSTSIRTDTTTLIKTYIECSIIPYLNRTKLASCVGILEPFINIANRSIREIDQDTFYNLTSLKKLDLERNILTKIGKNTFETLINLESLNLSNNKLTYIIPGTFRALKSLTFLKISNNEIKKVDSQTFDGLNSIAELQMDDICESCKTLNPARKSIWKIPIEINPFIFKNISKSLVTLYIGGIFNESINSSLLHGLNALKTLKLSYNNLKEIDYEIFRDLKNLEKLQLWHNNLSQIKNETFKNLKNLKQLSLTSNQLYLENLNYPIFKDLENLRTLSLKDNYLSNLNQSLFMNLKNLKELDLSNNKITYLHEDVLDILPQLETLHLNNNTMLRDIPLSLFENANTKVTNLYLENTAISQNNLSRIQSKREKINNNFKTILNSTSLNFLKQ